MAAGNPIISAFGGEIDRDYFGAWLSGFVDGEGCFMLMNHARPNGRPLRSARFYLALRRDDLPTLEAIKSYWGVGAIRARKGYGNQNPCSFLAINGRADLESILIPHFHRYPLVAKKRRDFETWERGVGVLARVAAKPRRGRGKDMGMFPWWTEADAREFDGLVALLAETRRYESVPEIEALAACPRADGQAMLFD